MPYKNGGTTMSKSMGGGVNQQTMLKNFEETMGCTAVKASELLGTNYSSYKSWKSCRRNMTGPTLKLIEMLTLVKGTIIGKKFGI